MADAPKHPIIAALIERFGAGGFSTDNKYNAICVMLDLGLIGIQGQARKIVDRDPIVEIQTATSHESANALLWSGWKLLGASSTEPFEAWLGRPRSIPQVALDGEPDA